MSLPFDSILCLRDSTRAVGHLSPNICFDDPTRVCHCHCHLPVFEFEQCFGATVHFHTLSVCSVLGTWSDPGCKHPVEVHNFQSVGTRAMAGCLFQRLSEASLFLKSFYFWDVFEFFCFLFSEKKRKTKS